MSQKLSNVNSIYGAPMGRSEFGRPNDYGHSSLYLYHVPLDSGGYDEGGAYWGLGQRLYCAECDEGEYREFIRADTRSKAMNILSIEKHQLKSKLGI